MSGTVVSAKISIETHPKSYYSVKYDETTLLLKYKAKITGADPVQLVISSYKIGNRNPCDPTKIDTSSIWNQPSSFQVTEDLESSKTYSYVASDELPYADWTAAQRDTIFSSASPYYHNGGYVCFAVIATFKALNGILQESSVSTTVIKVYKSLPFFQPVYDLWSNYSIWIFGITLVLTSAVIYYFKVVKKKS